jgi:anion-transporting  ArsA/GET3 family ATPase
MDSVSWRLFTELMKYSHTRKRYCRQSTDSRSQLSQEISSLTQEIQHLHHIIEDHDNSTEPIYLISLTRESRELSRSITLLQTFIMPEQIRVLELQLQQFETSRQLKMRQCRDLQRQIAHVRKCIEKAPQPPESPLLRETRSLKEKVTDAIKFYENQKKMIRGESEICLKTTVTVDDTTEILELIENVREMKMRRQEKEMELENLKRMHEKDIETLSQSRKQRDFWMHQEPIVFRRASKCDRKAVTSLFEMRGMEKRPPKRFVRETSPSLLAPKKIPAPAALEQQSKFYHPIPLYSTKSVLEKSMKHEKVK